MPAAIQRWLAVTAALVIRVWNTGRLSRAAVAVLIAAQVAIGADVYFLQSHAMIRSPIKRVNDLLSSGYEKKYEERLDVFKSWTRVRDALPEDAHVLLHDNHTHLGLSRRTTSDWGGWQFGISYGRLESAAEVWSLLRDLGVTHVIWENETSKGWDSIAGDLVFFDFAVNHTVGARRIGGLRVGRMPDDRPEARPYGRVAYFGCDKGYRSGLYELSQLTTPVFGPDRRNFPEPLRLATEGEAGSLIEEAEFAVTHPTCASGMDRELSAAGFKRVARRRQTNTGSGVKLYLFVRRR